MRRPWTFISKFLLPSIVATIVFLVYHQTLHYSFVFDDTIVLEKIATANLYSVIFELGWRPFSNLTLYFNYKLGGTNVFGYHLLNIFIHCLNALLLYFLVLKTLSLPKFNASYSLVEKHFIAFAIALLWGVHPLNTESVTYIVQRAEALCGTFLFLSLILMLAGENSHSKALKYLFFTLSALSCLIGFGTKEAMISAPFIIILYDIIFLSNGFKDFLKRKGSVYGTIFLVAIAVAIYLGLFKGYVSSAFFSIYDITPLDYFFNQSKVICHYLKLSFLPIGQCFDYCWPVETSLFRLLPYIISLLIAMVIMLWISYRNIYVGFCFIAFVLLLAPRSSFAPRPDLAVEHRMYMPLAALISLIVILFFVILKKIKNNFSRINVVFLNIASCLIFAVITAAYGIATIKRNSVYETPLKLWLDTVTKSPNNPRALNYLGIEYCKEKDFKKATDCFIKAIKIYPDYDLPLNNLANVLAMEKQFDMAINLYKKAIIASSGKKTKTMLQALQNMAKLLAQKKDWDSVLKISKFIVERYPENIQGNYLMGKAYLNVKEPFLATKCFMKLLLSSMHNEFEEKIANDISVCPDKSTSFKVLELLCSSAPTSSPNLTYEYAVMLLNDSKLEMAKKYFEKTLPVNFEKKALVLNNLAIISKKQGNLLQAESLFRKAIEEKTDYAAAHFNLGLLLLEKKDIQGALAEFNIAKKLAPNEKSIQNYIKLVNQINTQSNK